MGNGFQFIDIILFAMIAAFLILRLRGVLGRRDGHEGGYRDPFKPDVAPDASPDGSDEQSGDNIVQLPDRSEDGAPNMDPSVDDDLAEEILADDVLVSGIAGIRTADPSFNLEDFLVGSRVAFEMILSGYASGDRETLKNLLSPEVIGNFLMAIDAREKAGHTMEDTLVGIRSAEIVEAYMENGSAFVTAKFVSEQVNVVRDEEGQVVEGNPNQVTDVIDFWTFARDTRSRDPNWLLVATRSLD